MFIDVCYPQFNAIELNWTHYFFTEAARYNVFDYKTLA